MNSSELFEVLLESKKVTLGITSSSAASLRVFFIRRFKNYKEQMEALGFLDPIYEKLVVSLEYSEESGKAKFFLREKKKAPIEYSILQESEEDDAS